MKTRWLLPALVAAILIAPKTIASEGADLYADFCETCHGADAAGLKTFDGSRDAFQALLEGESEDMPDFFGVFEDEQIDALFRYVTK